VTLPTEFTLHIAGILERLSIPYHVGGSLRGHTPFDAEELRRSIPQAIGKDRKGTVLIKSPEDTILRKLDRRGGGVSERQWTDVLSILAAMKGRLDDDYLGVWAPELGVAELLERARREVADL
jgi:hypothetical protein